MKKIIFAFCFLFIFCLNSYGEYVIEDIKQTREIQNRISSIGFRLLNSNGIEKRTVFDYDKKDTKNAYSRYADRQIVLYKGLYYRLNSDDEIAAVLAHEISHSVDSYDGILRGFFSCFSFDSKKNEYKADKRGVDYMVHAGYHPIAMIVVMSKCFPQERYDWYSTHPLTTKRMMAVYEYIYKKYPEYLVNNPYKDNIYYQNFLLTSKENRSKLKDKIESNSKQSLNYN